MKCIKWKWKDIVLMFGMCFALLNVIKLVTLMEYQEINGFNIEIRPSNPPTKDNKKKSSSSFL